jgi:hypothetical protein
MLRCRYLDLHESFEIVVAQCSIVVLREVRYYSLCAGFDVVCQA